MEHDPVTGEPVVLDLRVALGSRGWRQRLLPGALRNWRAWGPLRPGWTLRPGLPMRAFAVSLAGAMVLAWFSLGIEDPRQETLWFLAWLALSTVLMLLEARNARAYVTPTRLVRRYGILGEGRRETPLATIERVDVDYSGLWPAGETWDLGDLVVVCARDRFVIGGVPDAAEAARAIIAVRDGKTLGG